MKHIFASILMSCVFCAALSAQPDPDRQQGERIAAYRVAIFTEVLNLTAEEAQGFWPVFNEFQAKREQLQKQLKPSKQLESMNDAEVEDYLKKYLELKQQEVDLEKDLTQKLRKVLPVRKIAKLPVAEREFRERLVARLKDLKEKRQERRGPGGRNR
jgi:hypothetical protein